MWMLLDKQDLLASSVLRSAKISQIPTVFATALLLK
jgi:hypothetical protein